MKPDQFRIISLLLISLFLLAASPLFAAEQRLALVIGNSNYTSAPLKNPVNDATDIAAALEKSGFTVILKKNVNLREMESAISDFGNRLKKGGVGLFYYAGHGMQVGGTNYLIPIGVRIERESDIKYEALDTGKILDEMGNANNGFNIVILDACRDNPFAHSFRSASRGLAIITNASVGTFISYSTGAGEVAQDGDGRNSPYAAALMEFIGEPGLAIEQIFKKVRQKLSKQTHGKQIPWELSSLQGDFFFNPVSSEANRSLLAEEKKVVLAEIVPPAKAIERSVKNLPPKFRDPATGMEFVLVKGGCFKMGDNFGDGLSGEKPVHEVCLDDYYIGKYEVTQKQWQKIMGSNISHFKKCGMDCPAESMSWIDANTFIAELNKTANQKYRLPTEAEWEYAARGAGKIEKFAGTSSADKLGDYAWQESNSYDQVHPAGKKKPNSLGLYDMTGNVWEWCLDWYDDGYYASSPKDNPTGPATGTNRLVRGCSWFDRANDCRASLRYSFSPKDSFKSIGFRLVKPQ